MTISGRPESGSRTVAPSVSGESRTIAAAPCLASVSPRKKSGAARFQATMSTTPSSSDPMPRTNTPPMPNRVVVPYSGSAYWIDASTNAPRSMTPPSRGSSPFMKKSLALAVSSRR